MPTQTRRSFTGTLAAAAGLAQAPRREFRPNIVIVYIDELRASALRLYNRDGLEMPNLARLARRGVTFNQAFTPHPLCMPARVSLWTGQYTSTHGSRYNQRPFPDDGRPSMAGILKESGYRLGIFGKNHCFTEPQLARWFDADLSLGSAAWRKAMSPAVVRTAAEHQKWIRAQGGGTMPPTVAPFPPETFETHLIAERAREFIGAQAGHPFCAWVSIPDPHHPMQTPREYSDRVPSGTVKLPPMRPGEMKAKNARMQIYDYLIRGSELPEPFLREFLRVYYAMTLFIDDEFGKLMDLLDRRGLTENTIVVLTADHGDFAAEHHLIIKTGSLLDSMVHIPMLISWPGRIREGHREEALVSHVDIMPTLLGLCGLAQPSKVQGRRLPLKSTDPKRTFVYSEYGNGDAEYTWKDAHAIGQARRLGDYELNTPVLFDHLARRERAGHLRMIRTAAHKLIVDSNGDREFYDLGKDPHELNNVQGQAAYRTAESDLQRLLASGRYLTLPTSAVFGTILLFYAARDHPPTTERHARSRLPPLRPSRTAEPADDPLRRSHGRIPGRFGQPRNPDAEPGPLRVPRHPLHAHVHRFAAVRAVARGVPHRTLPGGHPHGAVHGAAARRRAHLRRGPARRRLLHRRVPAPASPGRRGGRPGERADLPQARAADLPAAHGLCRYLAARPDRRARQ